MKSVYALFFFICAFAFSAQAQSLLIDPIHTIDNFENQDLTNSELDLESYITVTNNTNEDVGIIWKRIVADDCPQEWDTQVCDNNLCYFFTIDTNVSEEIGIDAPFELGANESFDGFVFHVWPRGVPGCCRVKIEFTTVDEPDVLIETALFDVSVNTDLVNCNFTSSTQEIAEAQLVSIFPNPTTDAFTLSNNDVVKQVDVFNSLGQKLKSFDFVNGEYLDISDLNAGLYSLALKNQDGVVLHSVMLDKI